MAKNYSQTGSAITPIKMPDSVFLSIGKLIRACAEIEDIVTLYVCKLAEISEAMAVVLLGATQLRKKLEIAEYLAAKHGPKMSELHEAAFPPAFFDMIECRNTMAHSMFLGLDDIGRLAFQTNKTLSPESNNVTQVILAYIDSSIEGWAVMAESLIPMLEESLELKAWREKRLQEPLNPHPKASRSGMPKTKRERPPKPSPASRR